ncbi:MAG: TetR/AcrR family transcriptional regulator [Paludibacteraceae bacterium]|nr:TetR/AcrR family transcriptional regulator [Paludibacteraceae bacterium]
MNLTYKIVETATDMFVKRGIKAVSVDEIAAELGISKRTLYEQVKSKDELVEQCIAFYHENCKKRFSEITESQCSVFEKLIKLIESQLNIIRSTNKNFLDELMSRMKEARKKREEEDKLKYHYHFINVIKEGQASGDILTEYEPEIVVKIIESQMMALGQSSFYDFSQISFFDVFRTLWSISLNGIATDKGRAIIKTMKI